MGYYKIQAYTGTGYYLNVKADWPIQRQTDVNIYQSSCPLDQIWSIATLGTNQQIKTINNLSYMLNANTSTWDCNVNTVNEDTYVNFEQVYSGVPWVYYIRLVSSTTKYLTASGNTSGSNVCWAPLASTDSGKKAQQWKLILTDLPTIYTRVVKGRQGLGQSQMETNAKYIYTYLSGRGYTKNAICGILGNMQEESGLNPAVWYTLDDLTQPFGIIQWRPGSYFVNWAKEQGIISTATAAAVNTLAYSDPKKLMDAELEFMTIKVNTSDWFKSNYYDDYGASRYLTADQYRNSTLDAGDLARIFDGAYVRSGLSTVALRDSDAKEWYRYNFL